MTDPLTATALRARRGDPAAAEEFVRRSQAEVWRLCAHLGDRAHADDLTQETYLRAFAALPRFTGRGPARVWLLTIARRTCIDHVRAAVRRRRVVTATGPDGVPERAHADHADGVSLQLLLDGLSPERRDVLVLTQLLGLSYAETAEVLGCPVGTVRSRVARARGELVTALAEAERRHGT